jgi:2-phospho-L-lactate transferase/gluconeogenesis factor (CofD/UPF0052 family)
VRGSASKAAFRAIEDADVGILGPSNPITSIGAILALESLREAVSKASLRIAVSPAALTAAPGSGAASKASRSTPVHGEGSSAARSAHKVREVALSRPKRDSFPESGVTRPARNLGIVLSGADHRG